MKHKVAEIIVGYRPNKMKNTVSVVSSEKAYQVFLDNWDKKTICLQEQFKLMLLNNSNEVLGIKTLSQGSMKATIVDIRVMFALTLKSGATAIITAHNHPSGKLKPSQPDIDIFKKIKEISHFHDINYLDNLIITEEGKFSFMDEGY
ncbi:MAG: JAB domain-containing protein [Lutibacter sp.]|nr:JAB domain-containing protein [Lutibacter sp.]